MDDLTWAPLTPADAGAIAALARAAADVDDTGLAPTPEMIEQGFSAPMLDAEHDTVGAWSADRLAGFAATTIRDQAVDGRALVMLQGSVHPEFRGRGIGAALLQRQETRADMLAAQQLPGLPVRYRASGGTEGSSSQRLLERHGYVPDTYFVTMQVDLPQWQSPGDEQRTVAPDADMLEATLDAHNDAFRDHRNFSPFPAEQWQHWMSAPGMQPHLSRVVVDQGRVLAYGIAAEYEPGKLHVELVGTRREARGSGLARQVLTAILLAAKQEGYTVCDLEVDTASPTGAGRLYSSVGFRQVRTISRYVRDVSA